MKSLKTPKGRMTLSAFNGGFAILVTAPAFQWRAFFDTAAEARQEWARVRDHLTTTKTKGE